MNVHVYVTSVAGTQTHRPTLDLCDEVQHTRTLSLHSTAYLPEHNKRDDKSFKTTILRDRPIT